MSNENLISNSSKQTVVTSRGRRRLMPQHAGRECPHAEADIGVCEAASLEASGVGGFAEWRSKAR